MELYRHGDVFLIREPLPPDAGVMPRTGDVILAEGEVTGHAHRIADPEVRMWSLGDQRYITVPRGASLTHEEHATIPLPPGDYKVVIQRVYTPTAPRNVVD